MRYCLILSLLAASLLIGCSNNNNGNRNNNTNSKQIRDLQATIAALQKAATSAAAQVATPGSAPTAASTATPAALPSPSLTPKPSPSPTPTPSPSPSPSPTPPPTPSPPPTPPPVSSAPVGGGCAVEFPVKVDANKDFFTTDHPGYTAARPVTCYLSAEAASAAGAKKGPIPEPPGYSFGSGQKIVGADLVASATYRTRTAASSCYWARLSGFGGSTADILANSNTDGPSVVTIGPADKGFTSSRCATWTRDLSPITTDPNAPFGIGTYIVGTDIAPGTWRSDGTGSCYWARLSGFSGTTPDIRANGNVSGSFIVTISPTDKGFTSSRCGMWTKVQ
jgi:outer membrane murein-binding lipoprotein Lpp